MTRIKYVGPFDEVEIDITEQRLGIPTRVKKNHQVEVPESIAYGRPPSKPDVPQWLLDGSANPDYDQGLGGLLDQPDNWQLVEPKTAEKTEAKS